MEYLRVHLGYIVLILIAAVATHLVFASWRAEHDARLVSEVKVHAAEDQVKSLEQQMQDRDAVAAQQISALRKQAASVKTPVQAIAAIPQVSNVPLNARVLPDNPQQVGVDAVPLFQELSSCKEQAVTLGACQANLKDTDAVVTQKNVEIAVLKKKPGFWKRLKSGAKKVGAGVAIGLVLRMALKGLLP